MDVDPDVAVVCRRMVALRRSRVRDKDMANMVDEIMDNFNKNNAPAVSPARMFFEQSRLEASRRHQKEQGRGSNASRKAQ